MGPRPNSSVYIGDLAEGVTEQVLYETFSQAGTIQSVRLCRDSQSRRPLGYAYVNYATPADASRALELLNHAVVCGKPLRLMPSQRDPSARRSGIGNVFAKNLDPEKVTNKVLHETFEQYGRVLSAKVATDASGKSKGYGFVQYEDPESATQAIEGLNLTELCGQQLFVGPFIPAKDRAVEPGKFCNVYVRNIGSDVDEDSLRAIFGEFGSITSTVVMRNTSGKSRGFGFVNFEVADDAARAVAEMDGYRHKGLKWRVNRAQKRDESDAKVGGQKQNRLVRSNLYLRNLDPQCQDDELWCLFEEFGMVENAKVLRDSSGNSKGVGFVQFAGPEDAEAAITGMNGKTVGNSPKPLFVTLAQRKQSPQTATSEDLDSFPGLVSPSGMGFAPTLSGLTGPNMAFYPASPSFFYGPMPVQPGHGIVNPYFLSMPSMGSGPLPMANGPIINPASGLVSIPSAPYGGIGSSPSAPLPRMGSGIISINSGPLPAVPGESLASAPLPMYGSGQLPLSDGPRRGRKPRGWNGANYSPQAPPSAPAMPQQARQPRNRPVLTSPFSAVQAVPPSFIQGPTDPHAMEMHPRNSARSMSSGSSIGQPTLMFSGMSSHMSSAMAEEAAAARRRIEERRLLRERVEQRNSQWAGEITQMLMDGLNQSQISQLLADNDALMDKVDACAVTLETAEPISCAPCATEDQKTDAETDIAAAQMISVPAT